MIKLSSEIIHSTYIHHTCIVKNIDDFSPILAKCDIYAAIVRNVRIISTIYILWELFSCAFEIEIYLRMLSKILLFQKMFSSKI